MFVILAPRACAVNEAESVGRGTIERMRWRRVALAALLVTTGACTSLSGLSGAPDAGAEAGADAGAEAAGDDGSAPLLDNGGFETPAAIGCGPGWQPGASTLTLVAEAHSGSYACRVCNGGGVEATIGVEQDPPLAPGSYALQAWVHAGDAAPTPQNGVVLEMTLTLPDASRTHLDSNADVTSAWTAVQLDPIVIPADVSPPYAVHLRSLDVVPPGTCFLVDDVVLVKQ
jgi:hypothetical protein